MHGGHTHKHSDGESEPDHNPIGEISIMGVNPRCQGRGIGKAVMIAGLKHLRYEGIFSAMLYVDAYNTSAINLYTSLGFTEWGRDVLYKQPLWYLTDPEDKNRYLLLIVNKKLEDLET